MTDDRAADFTPNFTRQFIGRCRACKVVVVSNRPGTQSCDCGANNKIKKKEIIGMDSGSKRKCGAQCTNAVGPACDCPCKGENHGSSH